MFTKTFKGISSKPESPNSTGVHSKRQSPNSSYLEKFTRQKSESPRSRSVGKVLQKEPNDYFKNYFRTKQKFSQTAQSQENIKRTGSCQEIIQSTQSKAKPKSSSVQKNQKFVKPSDHLKNLQTNIQKQKQNHVNQKNCQTRTSYTQLSPSRQTISFSSGFDLNKFLKKASPVVSYKDPLSNLNIYSKQQ